jgi:hypothetical protein
MGAEEGQDDIFPVSACAILALEGGNEGSTSCGGDWRLSAEAGNDGVPTTHWLSAVLKLCRACWHLDG